MIQLFVLIIGNMYLSGVQLGGDLRMNTKKTCK